MDCRKIIIGTANFGMKYGLGYKNVNQKEIKKILSFGKKNGIRTLDTAPSYKNAFENLRRNKIENWDIISKIPSIPKNIDNINHHIQKIFFSNLKKINLSKIHTILIHDEKDILNVTKGKKILKILNHFKKEKLVKRVGCSIYDSHKVKRVIKNYDFDVIQCPYNIFDKRLVDSGLFRLLKKRKINIHLRSIFLQGLLLKKKKDIPVQFKNNQKITKYYKLLEKYNLSNIEFCLSELDKIEYEKVLIGISHTNQLKDIINFKNHLNKSTNILKTKNLKLIDPRKWNYR